jgi:uncharacterized membrane protein YhhN
MKFITVKGLIHLGLALTAVGELFTATSRTRKILLGSMCGFHLHAALYHFAYEDEEIELGPVQKMCLTGGAAKRIVHDRP